MRLTREVGRRQTLTRWPSVPASTGAASFGAVRTLLLSEHLDAIDVSTMDSEHYMRIRPLKPALQATGAWPAQDPFDELIRVLEERAAQI